jgi:NADPH-dependent F420 reductase
MRIGIIGGTGKEGRGLAIRWAKAGQHVILGSRDPTRGREYARELTASGYPLDGGSNADACREAELVVLGVPYSAHTETLLALKNDLADRILVDITVPLNPPKIRQVHLPPGSAAALEAQGLLGPATRVVAALHHVSSVHLADPAHPIDCDVLVCGDDPEARGAVITLVSELGLRGLDAGPLRNAIALEALTPVLLHLNKFYGATSAGIRFTGLP